MAFGQLTHRESLSDTIVCLRANASNPYHWGICQSITKSTLSNANAGRDYRIFSEIAMILIEEAKSLFLNQSDLEVDLKTMYSQLTLPLLMFAYQHSVGQNSERQKLESKCLYN